MMKRAAVFILLAAAAGAAQTPETRLLWPQGAPGALGDGPEDKPSIAIYLPPREKATARL